jgi:hypothetical protein
VVTHLCADHLVAIRVPLRAQESHSHWPQRLALLVEDGSASVSISGSGADRINPDWYTRDRVTRVLDGQVT